jgi:ribosomal protein L24E
MSVANLVIDDPPPTPLARCVACGERIPAGTGISAVVEGRTLRFGCPDCRSKFGVDPDHYPDDRPFTDRSCCGGDEGREADGPPPASEWAL